MKEKTITINGKETAMLYCAATENCFEEVAGKSIYELNFHLQKDLIVLGLSTIVAAYAKRNEEPPVTSDTLLYDATPQELTELIKAAIELRAEWYGIPKVVEESIEKDKEAIGEDLPKN